MYIVNKIMKKYIVMKYLPKEIWMKIYEYEGLYYELMKNILY